MITQTYYISTGKKNAMYTLRCNRLSTGVPVCEGSFFPDFYVCTLAADEDRAIEKATAYFEAMRQRISDTADFKLLFDDAPEYTPGKRRGKLSLHATRQLEQIEAGVFPFGKHAGTQIVDAPDSYLLYFADKCKDAGLDAVSAALSSACMGVALTRDLIAKRDQVRAERAAIDSKSNYIGAVGERREFTGTVISAFEQGFTHDGKFHVEYVITKVRCGDDIVTYVGKHIAAVNDVISFKATIKKHSEYNNVKATQVNRPVLK